MKYRAIYYEQKLKTAIEIIIDTNKEFKTFETLLNANHVNVIEHPEGFSIIYDEEAYFKINNVLINIEGLDYPLAGNIIIAGKINENNYLTGLNNNITLEDINKKISYYAIIKK